ncbi:helix-turn-helix domain-containing protein [Corynebacterium auris]|uniref:helix-turn-helix domain-containing protein n=1 Tax=Corynebacterium auris TaxID=44750 RepID=UPI0025B4C58D|nr:helix-turn-helix domain-containing protein [Corynebacterium auris]WJY69021.1 fused phosphoenolpyruvate-protein phosphotransferase PtsP/GAF domain protein [Corynebacterium auris]
MSMLVKVLEHAQRGKTVPREVFAALSPDEQEAVRAFENNRRSEFGWRSITLSLLRTATDLSRGRDPMQVLEELVHSSRQIMHSDVAYISVNDEATATTSVFMTSGVVTDKFRNIRIPFGVGVLGNVAAKRKASWTHDHGKDPEVTHVPEVDEAVRAEGIRGILGAPLTHNGAVVGALMVGDRRPRFYTADEIVVLDSLASLASVAFETSQLIEDLEKAVATLQQAQEQSERQIRQLEALSEADAKLMDALTNGAQLHRVHEVITEALGCRAWFWRDRELVLPAPGAAEDAMRELIAVSEAEGGIATGKGMSALAISVNQRYLGAICLDCVVDASQARILHRASLTFAAIVLFREALVAAESRQATDLVRKIFAGTVTDEDVARLKRMTGLDLREDKSLYVVVVKPGKRPLSAVTLDRLLAERGLIFEHGDHMCAVLRAPAGPDKALGPILALAEEEKSEVFAGAVRLPEDLGDLVGAHAQAESLAAGMRSLDLANRVATLTTFGALGLLLNAGGATIDAIIDDTIGPLLRYDAQNHTELARTAEQFFDNGRNIGATAKALFIHENTVRQRVDRIASILGAGWNTGPHAFDIHLALRAWRIRGDDV